jgi:hypothetical protein
MKLLSAILILLIASVFSFAQDDDFTSYIPAVTPDGISSNAGTFRIGGPEPSSSEAVSSWASPVTTFDELLSTSGLSSVEIVDGEITMHIISKGGKIVAIDATGPAFKSNINEAKELVIAAYGRSKKLSSDSLFYDDKTLTLSIGFTSDTFSYALRLRRIR